jgi:glutaredoxin-like protein DUF836
VGAKETCSEGDPVQLRVYTKPGCHLCVELVDMITKLPFVDRLAIEEVDIELDEALFEKYCDTIPVLELPDGVRLYPPHFAAKVTQSIQAVLQQEASR